MNTEKYQKAKFVHEMMAEEAGHSLNMQVVLAGLPDEQLQMIENVVSQCRTARSGQNSYPTVTFVVDWEEQLV
jgi:hypothetical protein